MHRQMAHSSTLNPAQRKAVETTDGRVLILAGAGSGKTSVLTHRIAHLLSHHQVPPQAILALTFTNKAASEMRHRIASLVDSKLARHLTLCTFHSFCMQVLRKEIERLGYTSAFTLYDEKDVKRLVQHMARHMLEHEGSLPSLEPTLAKISAAKNRGESVLTVGELATWHDRFSAELYERLQGCMRAYNAVDFDSLLSLTNQLFEEFPDVLTRYQNRYQYIMIDEYQDTNPTQYRLASLLSAKHHNLCVVGDDDQSIYGWRGAEIQHILQFEAPSIIKLEQNYRSTPTILHAANAVIRHNKERHDKELWSHAEPGELIELFHAPNDADEASAIVQRMIKLHERERIPWKEIAVLYRSNALSRPLEIALIEAVWQKEGQWVRGIPYQVFGGTELYERSEIKDLIAYLKTISNPLDEEALLRIINLPRRGISDQTLDLITKTNRQTNIPLFSVLEGLAKADPQFDHLSQQLSNRAHAGIKSFVQLLQKYQTLFAPSTSSPRALHTSLKEFLQEIDYEKAIADDVKSDKMRSFKWENVLHCVENLRNYEEEMLEKDTSPSLVDFLSTTMLDRDQWTHRDQSFREDQVNLMTFHSAKGLEFTACFLAGLEDHIIPHEKSLLETGVEEERRLMYVAITRAKRFLYMSMARHRKRMGQEAESAPSRFLFEIPKDLIKIVPWKIA